MIECKYCGKEYTKNGIGTHIWRTHGDGKSHNPNIGYVKNKRKVWNIGLTIDDPRVKSGRDKLKEGLNTGRVVPAFTGKSHSTGTLKLMSKNSGGYRKGSGRGKAGWYKGYWCDSTWELIWVIYNLDHNKIFTRCPHKFKYTHSGKSHFYYPDFLLDDGKNIIEIKGFETERDRVKYSSISDKFNLIVLYEKDINKLKEYIKSKYSFNDITELYESI